MAIITSSDSDEISPQTSPVIVDYNGSPPNSPLPSVVSSVNSNSFNKDKNVGTSPIKSSYTTSNSEMNNENTINKPSIPFSITSILNRGDPVSKYSKDDSNIESQVFRYCQSALDQVTLSSAVLTSRQQQPIVTVSTASLVPAAVFAAAAGHHLPRKPTPWYPWAVASGVVGSGLAHHPTSSSHQIIFRESKDSVFHHRSVSMNNNNGSISPLNSKASHNYAERSDSRSLASSPLSPCIGHCNTSHSDHGGDVDMDDDNGSDTCSEKDSLQNKNKINGSNGRNKDNSLNHNNNSGINNNNRRKKKTRTVFTRSQVFQLESTFDMKRYLSSSERAGLAASLHLTETQNRRNKWKRQLAAELEAANMAHAAAQRIRAVPILYHTTATHHTHHSHDTNGNPNTTANANSGLSSSSHADNAAASLQAALSSYYYHPSHHTSSAAAFMSAGNHVGANVASAATAAAIRTPTISGLV